MIDLGIETGEITVLPEEVIRPSDESADPKQLRFAGKVVILRNETVHVDRRFAGHLREVINNTETIEVTGQSEPEVQHVTTTVRWYRVIGGKG